MEFRIADTFTDSLARLTGDEQRAVKTTAFDLQLNPANPGMSFHKLDKAKDKKFWSVRVNSDIRLIVHRSEASLLLCYVDHHDKAYDWAERRKLETHPKTGAAQFVEIRETVKEIVVPVYVQTETAASTLLRESRPLFAERSDDELLGYGVPVGIILMGLRIPEVLQHTIAHVLRHEPAEPLHSLSDALLIRRNDFPQVLRVHTPRECRRTDKVRKHHRDLAALGGVLGGRFWSSRRRCLALRDSRDWRSIKLSDCSQHSPAMPERYAKPIKVLIRQFTENVDIDVALGKALRILGHAELFEPVRNRLHGGVRRGS